MLLSGVNRRSARAKRCLTPDRRIGPYRDRLSLGKVPRGTRLGVPLVRGARDVRSNGPPCRTPGARHGSACRERSRRGRRFPRFQDRLAGSWPSVPAQAARRARARAEAVMIRAHMVVSSTLGAVEARTPLVADRTPAPRRFNTPLEARGPRLCRHCRRILGDVQHHPDHAIREWKDLFRSVMTGCAGRRSRAVWRWGCRGDASSHWRGPGAVHRMPAAGSANRPSRSL
jgi:hypothetical protein